MAKKDRDLNRSERAAALRAQHERAERNRRLGIGAAVLVALGLIAAAVFWMQGSTSEPAVNTKIPAAQGDHSLLVGNADAKHKVVVYEDFLCPYCREFEQGSRDALHAAAENGSVQIEYRPFQLLPDDYSKHTLAAFAYVLENETPSHALALHDVFYDNQPYEADDNKPAAAQIARWAKDLGISGNGVRDAIDSGMTEWAAAAKQAADEAGVNGTPTVMVDGKPLDGNSISDMIKNLEKQIAE